MLIFSDVTRLNVLLGRRSNLFSLAKTALNPRLYPNYILRTSSCLYKLRLFRPLAYFLAWTNVCIFGIECTPRVIIGRGLFLPHTVGTVIGAMKIGENVTIFQGVTLGARYADMSFDEHCRPQVGDGVIIGAGAKILGNVFIKSYTTVGANSVVVND